MTGTLYLQLRRAPFVAILAGTKRIEFRDATPHYDRLLSHAHERVRFRNGYHARAPEMTVRIRAVRRRAGGWRICLGGIESINDETRARVRAGG